MELFHSLFDWYMANLNYLTVALLMAIESTFLPLPSEESGPRILCNSYVQTYSL
jgi:membrane protein YqaA with SNARE-associated domain